MISFDGGIQEQIRLWPPNSIRLKLPKARLLPFRSAQGRSKTRSCCPKLWMISRDRACWLINVAAAIRAYLDGRAI